MKTMHHTRKRIECLLGQITALAFVIGISGCVSLHREKQVVMTLQLPHKTIELGQPCFVTVVVSNRSAHAIEFGNGLYLVEYGTAITEYPFSRKQQPLFSATDDLPKRQGVSEWSFPVLEIYRCDVMECINIEEAEKLFNHEKQILQPGEVWSNRVDLGSVFQGEGQYLVTGSFNQPANKYRHPIRNVFAPPVLLLVLDRTGRAGVSAYRRGQMINEDYQRQRGSGNKGVIK
jgi:hypothetical protein